MYDILCTIWSEQYYIICLDCCKYNYSIFQYCSNTEIDANETLDFTCVVFYQIWVLIFAIEEQKGNVSVKAAFVFLERLNSDFV